MVTSGINPEVTVALIRIVGIVPDIRLKSPDVVVKSASCDSLETLEIAPKMAFSGRYENFVLIPDGTR